MKLATAFLLGLAVTNSTYISDCGKELIVNGDFSTNDCTKEWCIFNGNNCVKGWIPEPQLEIGYGYLYTDKVQKQRVLELAPNSNSCVRQQFSSFEPGTYQLKVAYGARKGRSFDDCQFSISFNGQTLKSVKPKCYDIEDETIEFTVKNSCQGVLKFCGIGGDNNSYGAFLKTVSLIKTANLQPQPPLPPIKLPPIYLPQPPVENPPQQPQPPLPPIYLPQPPVYNPPQQPQQPQPPLPPIYLPQPPVYNPPQKPVYNPQQPVFPVYPPVDQNPSGLNLNSHSTQCFQRSYQLQGGQHEISFDYKVISQYPVKDSYLVVNVNGQVVRKVFPSQSGKLIKFVINASKGSNVLSLCSVGCQTENQHTISISNVAFSVKRCLGKWGSDLIVNGGFQNNDCKSDWCIWNQKTCKQNSVVPGWIASPEIQVGKGSIYNKALGNTWVSQLDPNANSCIRQNLNLKSGKYSLQFNYAGRSGISAKSNAFDVKLNGRVLKSFAPTDCELYESKFQFNSNSNPNSFLEFCGSGSSDSYGALIDNVKLFYYDQCGSFSWVPVKC